MKNQFLVIYKKPMLFSSLCVLLLMTYQGWRKIQSQRRDDYTINEIKKLVFIFDAIRYYAYDNKELPDENSLLQNLLENPGIDTWKGPYLAITNIFSESVIDFPGDDRWQKYRWDDLPFETRMLKIKQLLINSKIKKPTPHEIIIVPGYDGIYYTKDDVKGKFIIVFGKDYKHESFAIESYKGGIDYAAESD